MNPPTNREPDFTTDAGSVAARRAQLRAQIDAAERECGCRSGAFAAFSVLCVYLVGVTALGAWTAWATVASTGAFLFVVALAAGKTWALRRTRGARDRLLAELSATR